MANLKIEFQKPKLTLCNTNYAPLGTLTNKTHMSAHNVTLTSRVNETPYLSFDIQLGGLIDNNSTELLVKHKNDYFVIKNISMTSGDTNSATVKAEHIACELKGIMVSHFEDLTDVSPRNMWETIRTNCSMSRAIENRYIFETNIVDTYRCLSGEGEKSVYEHLLNIAEQFESCLLFSTDDDGIIHIKLLYGDINRGKFIRKGKDLKQLNLNFSTDSLFTKIIPFGATNDDGEELTIKGVNNGKSYITNYDYYLAKGMTGEEILNNPLCNQEYIYRNTDITDARDLLRLGKEELDKLSKPTLDGTIETIDLNVLEGSLYLSPILCEKIIVIDKDINYSISCKITEIEFMYDNPLESKIGISNVVRYGSTLRNLVRNSEVIGQVLTSGSNGKPNLNTSRIKSGTISSYDSSTWINLDNGDFNFKDKIKSVNNEFIIDLNDIGLSDAFVAQYQEDKVDINNRIEGINEEINSINGQLEAITLLVENTTYLQSMIDKASIDGIGCVKLKKGNYTTSTLRPRSGVILDLNGSTLKLADNANSPLFYAIENGVTYSVDKFSVINGILDLNNSSNKTTNQSAGAIWLLDSNNLIFKDLVIKNGFRSLLNFYRVNNVIIENVNCLNCGLENDLNYYTYGISFEENCSNININNFSMDNTYGFGMHIKDSKQVKLTNITFNDTHMKNQSIGLTITNSDNVEIKNYHHTASDKLSIECNYSRNVTFKNIFIDNTSLPLTFGDNGSGNFNENIEVFNLVTKNTYGSYSMNINYLNYAKISNFNLDKQISTTYAIQSNLINFENGVINSNFLTIYNYERFLFNNVKFNNVDIALKNYHTTNIYIKPFAITNGSSANINFKTLTNVEYKTNGIIHLFSRFSDNISQCSYTSYLYVILPDGLYIKELNNVDGSYGRKMACTTNGDNLVITNNAGVNVAVEIRTS